MSAVFLLSFCTRNNKSLRGFYRRPFSKILDGNRISYNSNSGNVEKLDKSSKNA
ncbi:hypothetical protein QJS04_geneDACA024293 [Acorus gramineus]|uniref:Uncharacterized protein n=1 Tax=Acorus gramineus TaxID=55184 RepID=A0AAV9A3G5_ACOGR|nr:hypothetical protein QJS04_geneDACA024293 [Acorus gramineus]